SHLRFGPKPIRSTYLIGAANFVACHQENFLETQDMLEVAAVGGTFLLNTAAPPERAWDRLPRQIQETILRKRLKLYVIDAYAVAEKAGLGRRINTVMQVCFFAIAKVMPLEEAIEAIKESIRKTYGRKSEQIVTMNLAAVDATLAHLHEVSVPARATATKALPPRVADEAPDFVHRVTARIMAGQGDLLPVSALPVDGTYPTSTARWEKRNIA